MTYCDTRVRCLCGHGEDRHPSHGPCEVGTCGCPYWSLQEDPSYDPQGASVTVAADRTGVSR